MTSDSENKLKYSSNRLNRTSSIKYIDTIASSLLLQTEATQKITITTEFSNVSEVSSCELHQLRCVSGKCITVDQLCDKVHFSN